MSKQLSTLQRLKLIYKTSRFPWKRHVMVGWDLAGNEYWEMPNPNHPAGRWKRWVQMKENDGDIAIFKENDLPVQWQAWLRHTRYEPPAKEELIREQYRLAKLQQKVRQLEVEADEERAEEQEKEPLQQQQKEGPDVAEGSQPEGQGETFVPGSWMPTSSRRR
ncbi:hypothetical protein BDB00DRAFT_884691 [Zychaea mexicana]|uniref:uncharacterized protein n=1 Tax=Zychaea mexicana TaxID=64656 RepID=UPI0022FE58C8|nr:uncharacterized protein BDB00DRAFT_884691 [Zychaea mexicana]KAI9488920.1 hypothetical protein BDB00DRAFT_884691 [Zychaea mexicana]